MAEGTYRLVRGLDLKKSNTACTYVTTGFPRNRSSFFRQANSMEKSVDVENDGQEEENFDEVIGDEVTLEGRQGHFKEVETIHR